MAEALRHPGVLLGVARFFHDPRASMRGMLETRPGEGRLLAYAFGAALVLLAGRVAGLVAAAEAVGADLPGRIAAEAAATIFFVPLVWYGLAALGALIARVSGGQGGWREGRAAFFWAALVSAPVLVVTGLAPLAMAGAPRWIAIGVAQTGPVFFAWALAQCYAEAFGFRRAWAVFAVIAALVLALFAAALAAPI